MMNIDVRDRRTAACTVRLPYSCRDPMEGILTGTTSAYTYPFQMVSVATDIVVFHVSNSGGLQIALVRRKTDAAAFPDFWALPGGFFQPDIDRDIADCVLRELSDEAGLVLPFSVGKGPHLELIGVYSNLERDPRPERIISIAYLAVLTEGQVATLAPVPSTDVTEAHWFPYEALSELNLAFDHKEIVQDARRRLADRIGFARKDDERPDLLFAFLPDRFTLTEAQAVVQALRGEIVDKSNFRKYIDKFVVATGEIIPMKTRPAALYRRRNVDLDGTRDLPLANLAPLQNLASHYRIRHFDLLLAGLNTATGSAIAMLSKIVETYGRHGKYTLRATMVPDLRIVDERTERVLATVKWQPKKRSFVCTTLAPPTALSELGLTDLRAWNTGPHKSTFRLNCTQGEWDRLEAVLEMSASHISVR